MLIDYCVYYEARTQCHTEWSLPLYMASNKHALHDIRFRFKADNIWTVISTNHPELRPNEVSKDISLEPIVTHDLTIKTTIHHTIQLVLWLHVL